jgi:glycogen debranching enzyme
LAGAGPSRWTCRPTNSNASRRSQNTLQPFWIEDKEYYVLALDSDGRQVDGLASNIGHLLWSGIATPNRAGPRLFSGWRVRTLATDAARYNPVGYHTGTIWPFFDNAFIAWALRRYGLTQEASRLTQAMINASQYFRGRLPETFAGYNAN